MVAVTAPPSRPSVILRADMCHSEPTSCPEQGTATRPSVPAEVKGRRSYFATFFSAFSADFLRDLCGSSSCLCRVPGEVAEGISHSSALTHREPIFLKAAATRQPQLQSFRARPSVPAEVKGRRSYFATFFSAFSADFLRDLCGSSSCLCRVPGELAEGISHSSALTHREPIYLKAAATRQPQLQSFRARPKDGRGTCCSPA